ncbi:hypothetical protein IQ268_28385 [Oculatella sp. LEGE 06141]|uniref:hypothetical protein n=1 Tax=Oculatella sp. LEGE 06141 TaxID=1828648 RepID=UPI00187ED6B9|nr:hypothetical protein [Oculatella sp. LEGE 06141]MBE9182472.1 hypothetical protein [Oculatella sp. LEGE 06141]
MQRGPGVAAPAIAVSVLLPTFCESAIEHVSKSSPVVVSVAAYTFCNRANGLDSADRSQHSDRQSQN